MPTKILSVDDSKTIRMIVKKAFQPYNCVVFEAENGVEGLAAATKENGNLAKAVIAEERQASMRAQMGVI